MTFDQRKSLIPQDPNLRDLLNLFKKEIFLDINCHHVGTIESFDPATQTATVTIGYKKTYFVSDEVKGFVPKLVDYPVIAECPVLFLGGSDFCMTFPVEQGDECLLIFNDRDFDIFLTGNKNAANPTPRAHSFADAIALVGIRSVNNIIPAFNSQYAAISTKSGEVFVGVNNDRVRLKKGDVTLDVETDKILGTVGTSGVTLEIDSSGKFKVENASGEYTAALVQLLTDIQNATVTTALGSQPLIMPTFTADLAIFQSFEP